MKRLKLKRKYLVIVTIIVTILSVKTIDLYINRVNFIKQKIEQCDTSKKSTCSIYESRQYLLNK